jgi:hypothetical protein
MYATLFFLACNLAGSTLSYNHIVSTIDDLSTVVAEEEPLFEGDDGRVKTAKLMLLLSWRESGWQTSALSPGGDAGVMQIRSPEMWGTTRAALMKDRQLAFRIGLKVLHHMKDVCGGNVEHWLGGYASGKCGGAKSVVLARCYPIGACNW